jgi:NAD(P)-dependent dehydrogenase (short-subunit alcohol dehydrogenase family)
MKKDKRITWQHVDAVRLDLTGWQVAIVGGTGGLGREISKKLAARGARVTVVGQTFRDANVPGIEFMKADLSLMGEARRVAKALPAEQLDLIVFTTGIFAGPQRQTTAEGIERDMAVSYLSRLVILRELGSRLGKDRPKERAKLQPRVFVMGFPGTGQAGTPGDLNAEKNYSAMTVHMNTVAGNEMLVLDAAKRYPHATFFGLNPGLIKTNIRDNFLGKDSLKSRLVESIIGLFTPSAEAYAERITPLLVSPDIEAHSGAMFNQKGVAILPSPALTDSAHISKFLAESEALVARGNAA